MTVGAVVTAPNDGSDVDDEDDVVIVGPNDNSPLVDLVTSGALKLIVDEISDELVVVAVASLLPKLKFIGAAAGLTDDKGTASEILAVDDEVTVSVLAGLRPKLKPEVGVLDEVVVAAIVVAADNGDKIDVDELFDGVRPVVGAEIPNEKLLLDVSTEETTLGTEITGNAEACVFEVPEPILGTSNVVLFTATLWAASLANFSSSFFFFSNVSSSDSKAVNNASTLFSSMLRSCSRSFGLDIKGCSGGFDPSSDSDDLGFGDVFTDVWTMSDILGIVIFLSTLDDPPAEAETSTSPPWSSFLFVAFSSAKATRLMEVVLVVVVVLELPLVALGVRVDVLLSINL